MNHKEKESQIGYVPWERRRVGGVVLARLLVLCREESVMHTAQSRQS